MPLVPASPPTDRPGSCGSGSLIRDLFFTIATSVLSAAGLLLLTKILALRLGPDGFGAYLLCRRVVSVLADFSTVPLGLAIARYVSLAKRPEEQSGTLVAGMMLATGFAGIAVVLGSTLRQPLASALFHNPESTTLVLLSLVFFWGYTFYSLLYGFYRGSLQMAQANGWHLGAMVVIPVAVGLQFANPRHLPLLLALLAVPLFCTICPLIRHVSPWFALRGSRTALSVHLATLLRYTLPRTVNGVALGSLFGTGPFLAPSLRIAGYLVAGQSLIGLTQIGPEAFGIVVLSRFARLASAGNREFLRDRLQRILAFVQDLGLYLAIHLFIFADEIVMLLLGPAYFQATPIIRMMIPSVVPYFAFSMLRSITEAVDERAINTRNLLAGGAMTLASSGLLAAWDTHGRGLAVGFSVGYFTLGALTVGYLWRRFRLRARGFRTTSIVAVNCVLAAAALAWKAWLLESLAAYWRVGGMLTGEMILLAIYLLILHRLPACWMLEVEQHLRDSFGAPFGGARVGT